MKQAYTEMEKEIEKSTKDRDLNTFFLMIERVSRQKSSNNTGYLKTAINKLKLTDI